MENWSTFTKPYSPGNTYLTGEVYGHSRFPDGYRIYTSAIVKEEYDKNRITTRNTIYELGEKTK
jgi:hypothetical protein